MKYKITKKELRECITEAVTTLLMENKDDDLLAQMLAGDKKAGAAARAAGEGMGIDMGSKSATGKKGRPNKAAMAQANADALKQMGDADSVMMKAKEDEPLPDKEMEIDIEDDGDNEEEERHERSVDFDFANLSTEELRSIKTSNPKGSQMYRKANRELITRKHMMDDYKETGTVPYGYKYDEATKSIEPTHTSFGRRNDDAQNGGGMDTGYMDFSTAGKGNWFNE